VRRDEAKEISLKKMICKQSQIPFLRLIDDIYDSFESKKCNNCWYHNIEGSECDLYRQLPEFYKDGFGCNNWRELKK